MGFSGGSEVKHLPAMQETQVQYPGQEDLLEKEMASHSNTPAWKIPWMEEPGRLQSMGWQSHTRQSNFASQLGWHLASPPRMCESIGCLHHPPEEGNQGLSH